VCVFLYVCVIWKPRNEAAWAGFGSYHHRGLNNDNYRSADKSLARSTSRCFFYGENISFDASLVFDI
jgi:hypothetical protein